MKTEYQIIPAQPGYFVILDVKMSNGELVPYRMPIVAWRVETDVDGGSFASTSEPVTLFHEPHDYGIIEHPSGSVFCYEFGIEFCLETVLEAMWEAKSEDQRGVSTIEWDRVLGALSEDCRRR